MKNILKCICMIVLSTTVGFSIAQKMNNTLCMFNGEFGRCRIIKECPDLTEIFESKPIEEVADRICGVNQNGDIQICCQSKIPCGQTSANSSSPWTVSFGTRKNGSFSFMCTGVLISDQHILSSGDCFNNTEGKHIIIGDYSLTDPNVPINSIYTYTMHAQYTLKTYNIGIGKLKVPINSFSDYVRPICIPNSNEISPPYLVTKWKYVVEQIVARSVAGPAESVNITYCQGIISSETPAAPFLTETVHVGAFHDINCGRKEVDPVLVRLNSKTQRRIILGVAAMGLRKCGPYILDVFTNVQSFTDWIIQHTN